MYVYTVHMFLKYVCTYIDIAENFISRNGLNESVLDVIDSAKKF